MYICIYIYTSWNGRPANRRHHIHVDLHYNVYICKYIHMHIFMQYMYIYIYIYLYVYVYMTCINMSTYIHVYIYMYIYTHILTYICTCIHNHHRAWESQSSWRGGLPSPTLCTFRYASIHIYTSIKIMMHTNIHQYENIYTCIQI